MTWKNAIVRSDRVLKCLGKLLTDVVVALAAELTLAEVPAVQNIIRGGLANSQRRKGNCARFCRKLHLHAWNLINDDAQKAETRGKIVVRSPSSYVVEAVVETSAALAK